MPELKNMTVEDRLAEKLKTAEFAQWFGEDDLRELVGKALDKAFFSPQIERDQWGSARGEKPSAIVEVASIEVKTKIDTMVMAALRERLAAEPEILDAVIADLAKISVEDLIRSAFMKTITNMMQLNEFNIAERIRQMLTTPR